MRSKFIIGDVHGCFNTLMALIKQLPKNADLVFVGDLIDRGPDSRLVVQYVRENNFNCVLGNHEELMIDAIEYSGTKPSISLYNTSWFHNGGAKTYDNYVGNPNKMLDDIEWMQKLPRYIIFEDEGLLVSHAPCGDFIEPLMELEKKLDLLDILDKHKFNNMQSNLCWNRAIPTKKSILFNVFGHNIISNFIFNKSGSLKVDPSIIEESGILLDKDINYAAIDTGAFSKRKDKFIGKLSCLEFPSMKIYQQENIEKEY